MLPITVAIIVGAIVITRHLRNKSQSDAEDKKGRKNRRRLSFNSEVLLKSFPPDKSVPPPIVNIVAFVKKIPSVEELVSTFGVLQKFPRFVSTVHENSGGSGWELRPFGPEQEQDQRKWLENHLRATIRTVHVPNAAAMRAAVDAEVASDLENYKQCPLWTVVRLVNDNAAVDTDCNKQYSVILFRVHHALGDGISLVESLGAAFQNAATGLPMQLDIAKHMSGGKGGSGVADRPSLFSLASSLLSVLGQAASAFDDPTALDPSDKASLSYSGRRRTIVMPTVRLDFVKALKNAAGCTVNDVMVAAYAGAVRRYTHALRPSLMHEHMRHRLLMPVAFPRPVEDPAQAMRNKWAFASLSAPVGESGALARIAAVRESTRLLKASPIVGVQFWVQTSLLPLLPAWLAQKTAFDLFSRHSAVFSNVPGPAEPVAVAGCAEPLLGFQIVFPNLLPQVRCLLPRSNEVEIDVIQS